MKPPYKCIAIARKSYLIKSMAPIVLTTVVLLLFTQNDATSQNFHAGYDHQRVRVRLKHGVPPPDFLKNLGLRPLLTQTSLTHFEKNTKKEVTLSRRPGSRASELLLRTYNLRCPGGMTAFEFSRILKSDYGDAVELVELVALPTLSEVPNDEFLSIQRPWLERIKALESWNIYKGDSSVIIAIVDDGVDVSHPDLRDKVAINAGEIPDNSIDDDGNGYIDDYLGGNLSADFDGTSPGDPKNSGDHGTCVAGIAAARTNNRIGIAGSGYSARILAVKTALMGVRSVPFGYEGIIFAVLRGAKVINCSWASQFGFSEIEQSIIDFATEQSVLVVASAGNTASIEPNYPATYRGVLSIGNTDVSDLIDSRSAYGINARIYAPGQGAYTTSNNGTYRTFGGTSAAAPFVAGAAATLFGRYRTLGARQVADLLISSGDDIAAANPALGAFMAPRLNMLRMLEPQAAQNFSAEVTDYQTLKGTSRVSDMQPGDTVILAINLAVHTRQEGVLQARLANTRFLDQQSFFLIDSTLNFNGSLSTVTLEYRLLVNRRNLVPDFFRLSLESGSGNLVSYLPLFSQPRFRTRKNERFEVSFFDNGLLGSVRPTQFGGSAYNLLAFGPLLTYAAPFFTSDDRVPLSSVQSRINSETTQASSDSPSIPFEYRQTGPPDSINPVRISTLVTPVSSASNFCRLTVSIKNVGTQALNNPRFGYLFDWNLGRYIGSDFSTLLYKPDSFRIGSTPVSTGVFQQVNPSRYFQSDLPNSLDRAFPVCASFFVSSTPRVSPQARSFNSSDNTMGIDPLDGINDLEASRLLGSRIDLSPDRDLRSDWLYYQGYRFTEPLMPEQTQRLDVYFGAHESEEELSGQIRSILSNDPSSTQSDDMEECVQILAGSGPDELVVRVAQRAYSIVSVLGVEVMRGHIDSPERGIIDVSMLPSGSYFFVSSGCYGSGAIPFSITR